jgi:hypothetical protein
MQLFVADTRYPDTLRPEIFEVRSQSLPAWPRQLSFLLQEVASAWWSGYPSPEVGTGLVLQIFHICISIDYLWKIRSCVKLLSQVVT